MSLVIGEWVSGHALLFRAAKLRQRVRRGIRIAAGIGRSDQSTRANG